MDILMQCVSWAWNMFISISFPIVYQGVTYNISLVGLLIFTTIVSTAVWLIFSFFE